MDVMKQKYYLIDTENVGDRWIDFIGKLKEEEILVVFYTKNHSKLLEETYLKQRYNRQICWVECVAGTNALDYQLEGVLSYLIATNEDAVYSIYSNDHDYKDAIDFWRQRDVEIDRIGYASNRSPAVLSASKNRVSYLPDTDDMTEQQLLIEIAKAMPTSNLNGWYHALVTLMGQETGKRYYEQIKGDEDKKAVLSGYLLEDAGDRKLHLIRLLFQQNHLQVSRAEEAYKIINVHNRKNLKAIKADFDKHFGNKTGEQAKYYKVLKPLVAILKGK